MSPVYPVFYIVVTVRIGLNTLTPETNKQFNSKWSQSFYLGTRVIKKIIPDQSTGPYQTITESRIGEL